MSEIAHNNNDNNNNNDAKMEQGMSGDRKDSSQTTTSPQQTSSDSFYSLEELLNCDNEEFKELSHIEDIPAYSESLEAEIVQLEREIACECNLNKAIKHTHTL